MQRRLKNTQHNSRLSTCSGSMKYLEAGNKPGILISPLAACWTGFESRRLAGQPWQRQTHNLHWDRGWETLQRTVPKSIRISFRISQPSLQGFHRAVRPSHSCSCLPVSIPVFPSTVFLPLSVSHMNRHASRMPVFFRLLEQKNDKGRMAGSEFRFNYPTPFPHHTNSS